MSSVQITNTNPVKHLWYKLNGISVVHFLHIGKTGGTAVKYSLKKDLKTKKYIFKFHSHLVTLRHIPVGEKVVFFLRDPISRFLSGFYSRKRKGQPRILRPWTPEEAIAFEIFATPQQLVTALVSSNEEERMRAEKAMKNIGHVRSSFWEWFENEDYFRSRLSDIFFIGFQETLSQDFEKLKIKLGLPQDAELPKDEVNSHRNPAGIDLNLDAHQREVLKKWYAKDYEFLNICKNIVK